MAHLGERSWFYLVQIIPRVSDVDLFFWKFQIGMPIMVNTYSFYFLIIIQNSNSSPDKPIHLTSQAKRLNFTSSSKFLVEPKNLIFILESMELHLLFPHQNSHLLMSFY